MTTTHVDASASSSFRCLRAKQAMGHLNIATLKRLSGALLMVWLAGCSEYQASTASASGAAQVRESEATGQRVAVPREGEARMRPVAAAVAMSATPQVGHVVSGTYRWMADWPETQSVHQWEAASGPTRIRVVARAREMMPSAGLRGVRLRYCVKPVIGAGASRLAGYKTCSAWTTVEGAGVAG
ncbi:hypothetical protein [Pandoraea eparura]|nr:hypothetical protein [Pandoraea eparura]